MSLSACSYHSMAEAQAVPYSVVELTNATLMEASTFGYVAPEGSIKPLTECGQEHLFAPKTCSTENGLVTFEWKTYKSSITSGAIIVDGVRTELSCELSEDDPWNSTYICLNTPSPLKRS